VKQRVVLGPKIQHACWASLPDLPAPPGGCHKRMASLNKNEAFQRALMRLCNIVGGWYVKHLEKTQNRSLEDNDRQPLMRSSSGEGLKGNCFSGFAHTQETGFEVRRQDDFTEERIKRAFDEVLWCKHMATLEARKKAGSVFEGPDRNMDSEGYVWSQLLLRVVF
jgi:general transcription factor 3C polypeptide 1